VPIACSRVLVLPGDLVIADDDGAVVVPIRVAPLLLKETLEHEEWETFSRLRLAQGGSLWTYYPLSEDGRREYEQWRRDKGK
jgi:regulator of RNase E activity RraA